MSGGVDSSVAAALLKKRGFRVVGVFMKPPSYAQGFGGRSGICNWEQDREDAMRVAAVLDIPLLTWDFSKTYERLVTRYMIDSYRKGITPNPDVMCNKEIKFGLFLAKALREGADYIATGHYARIAQVTSSSSSKVSQGRRKAAYKPDKLYKLLRSADRNKDQTYFLWTLTQKQLSRTLFPVGAYTKPEVRKLAKRFNLPTYDKKDSQGVCFVGPLKVREFLKRHIRPRQGEIIDTAGKILGTHDGVFYYTVGQRHGLNITAGGGPYFVVSKDLKRNIICVGGKKDLAAVQAKIKSAHWVSGRIRFPARAEVKIRYRTSSQKALLRRDGTLCFLKPAQAVTPGQSAVFYRGQEVLGGGIIQ